MNTVVDRTEAIRQIIAEQFGVPVAELKGEQTFRGDLKSDDLDEIELVMTIEDEFGFEINDEECEALAGMTVDGAIQYVHKRIAGA